MEQIVIIKPPNFGEFQLIVEQILGGVFREKGFVGPKIDSNPPEIAIRYEKSKTRLTVLYEFGDVAWIQVETLVAVGKWKEFSLAELAKLTLQKLKQNWASKKISDSSVLRELLQTYRDAVQEVF